MNASPMDVRDYWAIAKRRKLHLLIPFTLILGASAALAFLLPPVFKSEATILVEEKEVPAELAQTTVTGYVQQRIQEIRQRILTRQNVLALAKKIGYEGIQGADSIQKDEIVQAIRDGVGVENLDVKATTPGTSRQSTVTVAFTVSFEASNAVVAQRGAHELSTLFLEENRKQRTEQVEQVSEFITIESDRLRSEISNLEDQLAAFKEKNADALPQNVALNMRILEQTESKLELAYEKIRTLEDRSTTLGSQLSVTNPYRDVFTDGGRKVQTGNERLSALTSEYLRLTSTYSSRHPDVVRLKREIEALASQGAAGSAAARVLSRLTQASAELAAARQRYSSEHPDVRRLTNTVASLEGELRSVSQGTRTSQSVQRPVAPDNPTYINLKSQLDNVRAELRAQRSIHSRLERKLSDYEKRVAATPMVEREYLDLTKDYEAAKAKYREIKNKAYNAETAVQLEKNQKGERFTLVDPANRPSLPDRPNRLGIALLGFVLAVTIGVISAAIAEFMDRKIYGIRGLKALLEEPPLASIPVITPDGQMGHSGSRYVIGALFLILIVAGASMFVLNYGL